MSGFRDFVSGGRPEPTKLQLEFGQGETEMHKTASMSHVVTMTLKSGIVQHVDATHKLVEMHNKLSMAGRALFNPNPQRDSSGPESYGAMFLWDMLVREVEMQELLESLGAASFQVATLEGKVVLFRANETIAD